MAGEGHSTTFISGRCLYLNPNAVNANKRKREEEEGVAMMEEKAKRAMEKVDDITKTHFLNLGERVSEILMETALPIFEAALKTIRDKFVEESRRERAILKKRVQDEINEIFK